MTTAPAIAHRDRLGEDLWRLVSDVAVPLADVEPLTTLRWDGLRREAFRLSFSDGRTMKGRRLEKADVAARVADLLPLLYRQHFPELIGHHGCALLLEWIEGRTPEHSGVDNSFFEKSGALLGALHRVQPPEEITARHGSVATHWKRRLTENIERLVEIEALATDEAQAILRSARRNQPQEPEVGLIHGDFCPENFVTDGAKSLYVVDNETLAIDVLAYDLGRTWHRWSMNREESGAFFDGYRQFRSPDDYLVHALYWGVAVLSEAALFRFGGATGGGREIVRRLKSLTEQHG
jgi:hypothetical protein